MEANSIVFRHWDDVVFEHRNKSYGAYLLRQAYAQRLLSGLGVTVALVALVLSLQDISEKEIQEEILPPLTGAGHNPLPPPIMPQKSSRKPLQQPKERDAKSASILVTTDEVVDDEAVTALTEFIHDEGLDSGISGLPEGTGTLSVPEPEVVIERRVVDVAEVMPRYEGGLEAMMKFIQKKIRYPRAPRQLGIEGTVYVRFVVNGDGSISEVEILRGVHPDYDKEAMRVISMLPSWKGGSHNGRPVSVRMVLPIKFNLM